VARTPYQHRFRVRHVVRQGVQVEPRVVAYRAEYRARHERDAGARRYAGDDGVIGAVFHDPRGGDARALQPRLQPQAVGAARGEREHRHMAEPAQAARRDEHELLRERVQRFEPLGGEGLRDERGLELAVQHARDEVPGGAGDELQLHLRPGAVIAPKEGGQAHGRGAFERAEAQQAARRPVAQRRLGLGG